MRIKKKTRKRKKIKNPVIAAAAVQDVVDVFL